MHIHIQHSITRSITRCSVQFFHFERESFGAYGFPLYFRSSVFHWRSDGPTISTLTSFIFFYSNEKKIQPVLSISHHVTIGHPQDGFSRSENGSRFPDSAQSRLYRSLPSCICGECARLLPRGAHIQPRLAGRRVCFGLHAVHMHPAAAASLSARNAIRNGRDI